MNSIMIDPGQDRLINELFAWVSVDPKTQLEGICAAMLGGTPFQAVSSSRTTIEKLRPTLLAGLAGSGKRIKLVRFGKPEVIETLQP